MTKKEFLNFISNSKEDVLQQLLDLLDAMKIDCCVTGGLAVNAYVEPVVSLDLDLVVVAMAMEKLMKAATKLFKVEKSLIVLISAAQNLIYEFNYRQTLVIRRLFLILP